MAVDAAISDGTADVSVLVVNVHDSDGATCKKNRFHYGCCGDGVVDPN